MNRSKSIHGNGLAEVLLMNHRRDPLGEVATALERAGYRVRESRTVADSEKALAEHRPDVILLNPLVIKEGGLEFEILAPRSPDQAPVPVVLMLEDLNGMSRAQGLGTPFRDFVLRPYRPEECVHRIAQIVRTRGEFAALEQRTVKLQEQVSTDSKTGLLSDRHFREVLKIEFKRAERHKTPLSFLLIDVDDFKGINDSTDYAFGDEVLRQVAHSLRDNIRETDYAARFGGDEFVLLLPHTTPAEAVQTAIRIRKKIGASTLERGEHRHHVTVSIGIDTYDGHRDTNPQGLARRANKALHRAKQRGKNQVWLYDQQDASEAAEG